MEQIEKQPLNTKKAVLEAIEDARKQAKEGLLVEQVEQLYKEIYDAIEAMSVNVKSNTIVFLKTELNKTLIKYRPAEITQKVDYFMEFFKQAYPEGKRRKDFTYTLVDPDKITADQIVETLKFVNAHCKANKMTKEEKQAILPMIERVAKTDSLRHINQVRSMEYLRKAMHVRIEKTPKGHRLK
ncbi:MAG: hypothetical protein RSD02_08660 [Niameybacter sp.]